MLNDLSSTLPEPGNSRGRLKVFLGYAAGVGKTFAMLEAAHQRLQGGMDVAVAVVDTHQHPETEKLLEGLEILPLLQLDGREEMNLDAALARRPQLALVDELAHANAPGVRHPRRYQDVEELLAAGIDVYTTVNIQNLESLNDIVQQITGVRVLETVPDRIFDEAYEIELIDLPAGELLQRIEEGKVRPSGQAAPSGGEFFRRGNLTALRELAMRRAAGRVDTQMRSYMQLKDISGPWPAGENILVSLSSHPLGDQLVRAGRRLADDLKAPWFVVFVETPGHQKMPPENNARIQRNLALAEQLGAQVFRVHGNSVPEEIVRFSQQHNITKIIAGKPLRPRWQEFFQPSVIDEIIRRSGRVDVYMIGEDARRLQKIHLGAWVPHRPLLRYAASLALVVAATFLGTAIHPYLEPTNLVMIYLAAVVIAAVFLGRGPSMLASLASVVAFDFFLINPRFSLAVSDTQYLITFFGLLVVGLIISNSASLLRDRLEALKKRENQTRALNRFGQELTGAASLEQVLECVVRNTEEMFDRQVAVILPEKEGLISKASTGGFLLNDAEMGAVEWSFKNGLPSGRGTETMPDVAVRCSPLKTARGVIGVMVIQPLEPDDQLAPDQRLLFSGFNNLSALAIERARFAEEAVQAEALRGAERLQSALLNSISHQLRTPLAAITGVLTGLEISQQSQDGAARLDLDTQMELIHSAVDQANQLNRLLENLLNMTRLEAGVIHVSCEPGEMQDLIGAVIGQQAALLAGRKVDIEAPPDLPLALMDAVLTGQVLTNLLENACKYSPPGSPIQVAARGAGDAVEVEVCDAGYGIPEEDLEHIFDKFYRVQHPQQVTGSGLGLSICKGIVEAQGGKIWARNNPQGGAAVTFSLPVHREEDAA